MLIHIGEQQSKLFQSREIHSIASQEESVYSKLPNFSNRIREHIVKILRSSSDVFKGRENLIIRYYPSYIPVIH